VEDMVVFPNISLFSRLTFINFYKKITNKCRIIIGSKQIYFVCSMTSQVTFTYTICYLTVLRIAG